MSHRHRSRQQRQEYVKRFTTRYGMTRQEFRDLKLSDPQKAHSLRMRPIKAISQYFKQVAH